MRRCKSGQLIRPSGMSGIKALKYWCRFSRPHHSSASELLQKRHRLLRDSTRPIIPFGTFLVVLSLSVRHRAVRIVAAISLKECAEENPILSYHRLLVLMFHNGT